LPLQLALAANECGQRRPFATNRRGKLACYMQNCEQKNSAALPVV
jgi:hypothetical protein